MGDVIPHFCTGSGCEALHGGRGESDDVKIAKIGADRDIEVARLARSEARQAIDAEVEETEIIAEAGVQEAVAEAVVLGEMLTAAEPEMPPDAPVEITEPEPEPVLEETVPEPPETGSEPPKDKNGSGWWAGYR